MRKTYEECIQGVECPCKDPCIHEEQQQAVQQRLDLHSIPKSFPFADEEKYYSDLTGEFISEKYMSDVNEYFTQLMIKLIPYIEAKIFINLDEEIRG